MWASCPFDNVFRKLICLPKIFLERKETNLKWKYTSKKRWNSSAFYHGYEKKNLDCLTYHLCCMHNSWSLLAEIFHINLALHKIHSNRSKGQASFIISWSDICNPSYSSCLKGEKRYSLGEWGVAHNPRSMCGRENKVPLCQRGNVLKFGDVILP